MTAAHCVIKSFEYNTTNGTILLPISLNEIYPTHASMFKIYAGADNISFIEKEKYPGPPVVAVNVKYIIVVCIYFNYFL